LHGRLGEGGVEHGDTGGLVQQIDVDIGEQIEQCMADVGDGEDLTVEKIDPIRRKVDPQGDGAEGPSRWGSCRILSRSQNTLTKQGLTSQDGPCPRLKHLLSWIMRGCLKSLI